MTPGPRPGLDPEGAGTRRQKQQSRTARFRRVAKNHAKTLGPILPVPPARGFDADGWPRIGADQVFVTRSGERYHTGWCLTAIGTADDNLRRLIVISRDTIAGRRICLDCSREDFRR